MTTSTYHGESTAAQLVGNRLEEYAVHLHSSAAIGVGNVIREELADVWKDCHAHGWDGYGSAAVSWEVYKQAERLLYALPLGIPTPSVGAEPDGHITLEWYRGPRCTLSVSVSPDGVLHYAALIGSAKAMGSEPFLGEVPKRILQLICDVYEC